MLCEWDQTLFIPSLPSRSYLRHQTPVLAPHYSFNAGKYYIVSGILFKNRLYPFLLWPVSIYCLDMNTTDPHAYQVAGCEYPHWPRPLPPTSPTLRSTHQVRDNCSTCHASIWLLSVYNYYQYLISIVDTVPTGLTFDTEASVVLSSRTMSRYSVTGRICMETQVVFRKGAIYICIWF